MLAFYLPQLCCSGDLLQGVPVALLHLREGERHLGPDHRLQPGVHELEGALDEGGEVDQVVQRALKAVMDGEGGDEADHLLVPCGLKAVLPQVTNGGRSEVLQVCQQQDSDLIVEIFLGQRGQEVVDDGCS